MKTYSVAATAAALAVICCSIALAQTQRFADRGLDLIASTPEELAAHLKTEVQKWGRVIKERGMRAE